jgi:excisionase family DNA binding protein
MRASLDEEDLQAIVQAVLEALQPVLEANRSHHEDDALLTVSECADYLRTSKAMIYGWVSDSQHGLSDFPYRKAGKRLLFSRAELLAWTKKK